MPLTYADAGLAVIRPVISRVRPLPTSVLLPPRLDLVKS